MYIQTYIPETSFPAPYGALHVLPELLELAVEGPLLLRSRIAELRDQDGLQRVACICDQNKRKLLLYV